MNKKIKITKAKTKNIAVGFAKPLLPTVLHSDTGQYPSEETLEFIKNFDCIKCGGLLNGDIK